MAVAKKMADMMERQSWIRRMFEEGAKLKAELGAENVYDFSLGNPDLSPPDAFLKTISALASDPALPHGYMPNPGWPQVRQAVAEYLSTEQKVKLAMDQVLMTCGAAGALNCAIKALFDPGDELITPTPYFVEYGTYAANHGGVLVTVPSAEGFRLDPAAIEAAITAKTKAVLINSPNNPTGVVYPAEDLAALAEVLTAAKAKYGRTIYLLSDEPYRKIVYDGVTVPPVLAAYDHSIVMSSYSKDLSIAGERIGYLVINPAAEDAAAVMGACTLANRCLGFVNAPSLAQLAVAKLQGVSVDMSRYQIRRDALYDGLVAKGYDVVKPEGAFYFFPKSPVEDDVAFVGLLKEERILAVPGRGFGLPGYFRLSYAVPDATIENSIPGFGRALKKAIG